MSTPLQYLDFGKMSSDERILLIDQLWQSFAGELPALSAVQQADFNRRIADTEASPDDVSSLEEVLTRIEKVR